MTLLDRCRPDEIPVIYNLDQPFAVDGTTTSSLRIRATHNAPCPDLDKTVAVTGYVVGCWSTADADGCRTVHVVSNGTMCLHIAGEPLGDACSAECAAVSTEQIAISSAGGRPGNRVPWTLTIVGNVADGYQPPCLGDVSNACNPSGCFP